MALANQTIDERPVSSIFSAGRIFYLVNNIVYYSQVMEGDSVAFLSKCHSKNDPTAQQLNDILATDGGTIPINGATKGVSIKEVIGGILVFCSNGVWAITGPDKGFKATEFSVDKISNEGCVSAQSIVQVSDVTYYWGSTKIHVIQRTSLSDLQELSIVDGTIKSFYTKIPLVAKKRCYGFYNKKDDIIEWFYSSDTETSTTILYAHNNSIILDLKTQGFFPQTINSTTTEPSLGGPTGQFVVGGVDLSGLRDDSNVYIGASLVQAGSQTAYTLDIGRRDDITFQDFGADYPTAYLETGYETLQKPSNKKAIPYITNHFRQTEENWVDDGLGGLKLDLQSGCKMRAKWDWNNSSSNGRWSPAQQVYRFSRMYIPSSAGAFDSGETVITTRNKMLGRGKALSIRFEQESGKDMQLLGYTMQFSIKGRI